MKRARRGAALLEVLVAITLVTLIGVSSVRLVRDVGETVRLVSDDESSVRAASDFLNAVSLWTREQLDQRLGPREQGPWVLDIRRVTPDLYRAILLDDTGAIVLETALFRPRPRA